MSNSDSEYEVLSRLKETPEIFERIQNSTQQELQLQQSLRKQYPAEIVRAALTLHELRQVAKKKFSRGDQLWLDRKGLEQSTSEFVAQHKAKRFAVAPSPVYDLCSGIGADAIAIAREGQHVVCVDRSRVAGLRVQLNSAIYDVADRISFQQSDVRDIDVASSWIHLDPDRRTGNRRTIRLEEYEPPLPFLQSLTESCVGGAIKLSPASNFGGKFFDCEIELISLHGECKEATVWFGQAATEQDWRATLLPSGYSLAGNPLEHYPNIGELANYIYDPDPAVVRAGLIDLLADELQLHRLDDAEEYLSSDELISCPAITPFRVIDVLPHRDKDIRGYFREHQFGDVEIKCRHVPTDANQIRKRLRLNGAGRITLFIARLQGKTRAIIAERIPPRLSE